MSTTPTPAHVPPWSRRGFLKRAAAATALMASGPGPSDAASAAETPSGNGNRGKVTRISEHLSVYHGPVNIGIVRDGAKALLIDAGDGSVTQVLDQLGISGVAQIAVYASPPRPGVRRLRNGGRGGLSLCPCQRTRVFCRAGRLLERRPAPVARLRVSTAPFDARRAAARGPDARRRAPVGIRARAGECAQYARPHRRVRQLSGRGRWGAGPVQRRLPLRHGSAVGRVQPAERVQQGQAARGRVSRLYG